MTRVVSTPRRFLALILVLVGLQPLVTAQGENGYLRGKSNWLVGYTFQEAEFEETIGMGAGSVLRVDRRTVGLYVNVGLRDDLDLVVQPLYQRAAFRDFMIVPPEENLTDLQVYAKWRLWKRELGPGELHVLAAPGFQTDLQNYETEGFLSLGAGQTDWRLRSPPRTTNSEAIRRTWVGSRRPSRSTPKSVEMR